MKLTKKQIEERESLKRYAKAEKEEEKRIDREFKANGFDIKPLTDEEFNKGL